MTEVSSAVDGSAGDSKARAGFLVDPVLIALTSLVLVGAVVFVSGLRLEPSLLVAAFVAGWSSAWSP
jgi:hypothetical protein